MSAPSILIVDDDADLRTILIRTFKRDLYTLLEAGNGEEAIRACQQQPPDLILLDIMMPGLDGASACEQIRILPGLQHVPIIMVTALEDPTSIKQSFDAGATDYITKPINPSVLRQRVRYLLRGAEAEARLRVSESRLRSIIEVSTDAVILIDAGRQIRLVNPAAERMFGYRAEEIEGQLLDRLLLAQPWPFDLDQITVTTAPPADTHFAVRGRRQNGAEFPLEGSVGWFDDNGQIMFTVTLRDITERVKSEAALRDSEERYRLIAENMTDTVWLVDTELRLLYVSPSAARARGFTLEEIQSMPFAAQLTPASLQKVMTELGGVLTREVLTQAPSRISRTMELELVCKDGSTYWEEITANLILDDQNRPISIVGVGRNITERKKAEANILRLNADLAQRARELAALNAASRALTSSLELRHVLETVVHEIQTLLNTERSAVLLRDATNNDLVFAAVAGESSDVLIGTHVPIDAGVAGWVAREGQAALIENVQADPRFWNKADARTGYTTRSVLAVPIEYRNTVWGVAEALNRHGGPFTEHDREMLEALASSAAIAIENARLYQAERDQSQRLQESQARLVHAEKMSALGRLVASLTHEINNPLQAVQSGLFLIHEELSVEPTHREMLHDINIIENEVRRISNLMQRLREFSRPVQLESRPTDLHGVLDNIVLLVSKQLEQQRVSTSKRWDQQLPRLMVNPDQLTQVFMNLVLNAIDAMPEGGTLSLSTTFERETADGASVRVDVADSGKGIPPEVLKRIFEPFYTTKSSGTGLGLAISYEIIQSLGGEISATSEPGSGTTFSVRLPVQAPV